MSKTPAGGEPDRIHPDDVDAFGESWSLPVELSKRYAKLGTFVETGSYWGGGIQQALDAGFKRVFSVESHRGRFSRARDRFIDDDRVVVAFGHSTAWLPDILGQLTEPALIFLDAHARSPERWPLLAELAMLQLAPCREHVLALDDIDIIYGKRGMEVHEAPHRLHLAIHAVNPAYRLQLVHSKVPGRPYAILLAEV